MDGPSKLLVVDDYATVASVIKAIAHLAGFKEVDVCHDGKSGLEITRAGKHGVALCDLKAGPMNGLKFPRLLRKEPFGINCVIIMTPANREQVMQLQQHDPGPIIDGVLAKPFTHLDLRTKLTEISNRKALTGLKDKL